MAVKVSRRREVAALVNLIEDGASMKKVASILAAYLADNHQTRLMELYLLDIRAELERRFGLVAVDVATAGRLTSELEKQIDRYIKSATGASEVEVIKTVDENLIGGVVISTTDATLDNSIRTKLQKLRSI